MPEREEEILRREICGERSAVINMEVSTSISAYFLKCSL